MSPQLKSSKSLFRLPWQSALVGGLLLVGAINIVLLCSQPMPKCHPTSLPMKHTWPWWVTKGFLAQERAPDVVVLGSSLMMNPLYQLEADFVNSNLDAVHHQRLLSLEDELGRRLNNQTTTAFNFALPGAMVSDDYMVLRTMVTTGRKPKLIVLGLSLRDFIDNHVRCAAATPTFKYLQYFDPIDDVADIAMPNLLDRLDYISGRALYLWNKKAEIQLSLASKLQSKLGPWLKENCLTALVSPDQSEQGIAGSLRNEIEEGDFILKADAPDVYEDNTGEYKTRFRRRNESLFVSQAAFLDKLLQLARQQQIKLLVFNMPLTRKNMLLMPSHSYETYMNRLRESCAKYDCQLVDLNNDTTFSQQDFHDTAHMNAHGGQKLIETIAKTIQSNRQLTELFTAEKESPKTAHRPRL